MLNRFFPYVMPVLVLRCALTATTATLVAAVALTGLVTPLPLQAQEGTFTLNLKNADIHSLIQTVSRQTGRNFVVDPRVKARVTVISSTPLSSEELYETFLSVLQVHGYAAVPSGDLIKIVPDVNAKQGPVPAYTQENSNSDQLVTQVIKVDNVPAAQLVPILRPLVPQQGHLAAYASTNTLIVTDRASNIERLIGIIQDIDRPDNDEVEIVQLRHASASEIIRILLNNMTTLTGGPNGISGIPKPTLGGLEFNRTVKDGGFDTFHNFFGITYNANHKVIFLYLMALVLVVVTLFVINRLLRMPLGRAWEALREDEIACKSLGLNPTIIKLTAFTIGATFAGFAGSFFASRQGFISPESFVFIESAIVLAIVVLGGLITSTMLTLLVLPALYAAFGGWLLPRLSPASLFTQVQPPLDAATRQLPGG
jgi:hypothetical protein